MKLIGFFLVYALFTFCISSKMNPFSFGRKSSAVKIGFPFSALIEPRITSRVF